jgi:CelD/BcsL family acetyltransferase involved in cellulose biosynthesis
MNAATGSVLSLASRFVPLVLPLDRGTIRPLLRQWTALAESGSPFVSPAFFLLTARHLAPGEPLFAGCTRAGALAGALPLLRRGRELVALASDHTQRFDYVGDPEALDALWEALRTLRGWDILRLARVPEASPLAARLPDLAARSGGHAVVTPHLYSPRFSLEGFEARLARKFRTELRRTAKKLEGLAFERVAGFDHGALRDALAIEAMSWKGTAGTAIASDPRTLRFYTTLARLYAAKGALTIAFLRANGRRIAMQLALEQGGTYYLLKPSFDPAFADYGPGQLLMNEVAEDARARGLLQCDLLGKDDAWKRKWSDDLQAHVRVDVYAPTALGRARYALETMRASLADATRPLRARLRSVTTGAPKEGRESR